MWFDDKKYGRFYFGLEVLELRHTRHLGYFGLMKDLEYGGKVHFSLDVDGLISIADLNYRWMESHNFRTWFPEFNFKKYYYFSVNHRVLRTELDAV